jgi:hypothetical protein
MKIDVAGVRVAGRPADAVAQVQEFLGQVTP